MDERTPKSKGAMCRSQASSMSENAGRVCLRAKHMQNAGAMTGQVLFRGRGDNSSKTIMEQQIKSVSGT